MKHVLLFFLMAFALAACGSAGANAGTKQPTPTAPAVLRASDPAAFVRASGKPQLVEFFAFW